MNDDPSALASGSSSPALPAARRLLTALLYLNGVYGLGILGLLLGSIAVPAPSSKPSASDRPPAGTPSSARDGDPFVPANAERLQMIAWAYLGLELLHIAVGVVAARSGSSAQPLDVHWRFSVTPWVAVLLLFVLARVFDHGARMRADLEGTV
jgi:DUF2975 family protein